MRLSHNLASLNVFRSYSKVLKEQSVALDKITSGYKVRNAKDDPNVIAQSEKTRIQIRGLQMASRNTQDGASILQTAESGMGNIGEMLIRIRELVVKAGNDSFTDSDKKIMQGEINQLLEGIENIANNTEFNGIKLLSADGAKKVGVNPPKTKEMPVGANVGEVVDIPFYDLTTVGLGLREEDPVDKSKFINLFKVGKSSDIDNALDKIDKAIEDVLSARSQYGALENRFEETLENIGEVSFKMEGADSKLRDADVAEQMMEYVRTDILTQTSFAIMYQTNNFPMDVLRILENVSSK